MICRKNCFISVQKYNFFSCITITFYFFKISIRKFSNLSNLIDILFFFITKDSFCATK